MQLKSLHLVGFKTFADKTEIAFGEGLTAVVGPNGCGKSNIADALLWVMGEQNPRLLRGAESRDVIFSGTDRRKKLGMAEVRLTVDNSDHSLPIQFAEVTITRRIYRSGESQYLLNNSPCRLKDIVELFLDTGVGKGAYSFVSQCEIDAVLSARAEDRRELFEEAAGIKKYRVKKREAVRRLESAEINLTRIRDIIHELEQQRAPMEAQSEQARRYRQLTERLQQIEVDLLVGDIQQADYELYAERTSRSADEEAIRSFDDRLATLERESAALAESLAEAERELENARNNRQAALSSVERTESQLQLAKQRESTSEQAAGDLDEELRDLAERIIGLTQQIDATRKRLEKGEAEEVALREKLLDARSRLREIEGAHAQAMRLSEDRQGMLRKMAEERARRETTLAALHDRLSETQARLEHSEAARQATAGALDTAVQRHAALRDSLQDIRSRTSRLQDERRSLDDQRRAVADEARTAASDLESTRRWLAEQQSRLNTLVELQESGEGFYQGVRALLTATRQREITGSYTPVVDLLTVPEDLRVAIEVALGGSAQDIVCDEEAEAKSAIEWLKRHRKGRATFLALPLLRPGKPLSSAEFAGFKGLLGIASQSVTADPKHRPVLDLLLGRVILADSMDAAVLASRKIAGGWSRIVTLEGELITPGGALTGGSLGGRGAHLVGRKGEIDDLRASLKSLGEQVEEKSRNADAANSRAREVEARLVQATKELSAVHAQAAAAESDHAAAQREVERLTKAVTEAGAEKDRLERSAQSLRDEIARAEEAQSAGHARDTSADDAIAEAVALARKLAADRDALRTEAIRLEVENGRAVEKRNALRREIHAAEDALALAQRTHAAKLALRETAGSQFADAHLLQRDLEHRLAAAREHLAGEEQRFAQWRDRRQERLNAGFEKASAIKDLTRERSARQQSLHESELAIARKEVRLTQTVQRLLEDYGITQEDALARPQVTEPPRETVNEVARLRREIRQMGAVNTGAVEEFERLTERHDFLVKQRDDLDGARRSILAAIEEIDESTRGTFLETFETVSEAFSRLFARLFGGGTTRLVLTDPDDLLETGIEVIAQPPGKKPQHLSLLSGGERALTAVALIFSFLAVRPSPFVLLDEVDAPLDGANVEKFVHLVKDFTAQTQFLIITHNPTTMEAAPTWYGVTMREQGVSSILAYRVPQDSVESEPDAAVVLSRA